MNISAHQQPPAELIGSLAVAETRKEGAERLAALIGARLVVVLVWDDEVGSPQPAPGFQQTLPGGANWRHLLARCAEPGEFSLPVGDGETARAFVSPERTAVVLIGGRPQITPRQLADAIPLLLPLLRSEAQAQAALARVRAAMDAHRHASALTSALDQARRQAAANAVALQRAATDLADEVRALEIINETGALIASQLDQESIVQAVVDAGVALTGAQFGAFFYNAVATDGGKLLLYALSGAPKQAFASFPHPRATAVFSPTFHGEGVVRSDDITKDARYGLTEPHRGMPEGHLPVRSYLAIPVVSRSGEVIGGLFFGHEEVGRFAAKHERLMSGISAQAAVAIDNARLYQTARLELQKREQVQATLRETDRRLKAVLNNATVAIFLVNEQQECVYMNAAAERLTGFSLIEATGRPLHDVIHHTRPDGSHFPIHECPIEQAFPENQQQQGEEIFVHKDGRFYPVAFTASPIRDEAAKTVGTIVEVRDISKEKRNERTRDLLMREVDHRARNALAVVHSILHLTKAEHIDSYRDIVIGRVNALARAQGSLADRKWEGAPLREVIEAGVLAVGEIERFTLSGPDVILSPEQVQPFSLIVHELATNARKYGALSVMDGKVVVSWTRSSDKGEDCLVWMERGGPIPIAPARFGFGSRLVRELASQIGATVETSWDVQGLRVTLHGPNGTFRL